MVLILLEIERILVKIVWPVRPFCLREIFLECILSIIHLLFFIYLYRYWKLRVGSTRPILSRAFRRNNRTTKSQTGNILDVSGIWKLRGLSNAIRCSTLSIENTNLKKNYALLWFFKKCHLLCFNLKCTLLTFKYFKNHI